MSLNIETMQHQKGKSSLYKASVCEEPIKYRKTNTHTHKLAEKVHHRPVLHRGQQVLHGRTSPPFLCIVPTSSSSVHLGVSPLKGILRMDGFAGHMTTPDQLAPLHSCEKGFLVFHDGVHRDPYKVIGFAASLV